MKAFSILVVTSIAQTTNAFVPSSISPYFELSSQTTPLQEAVTSSALYMANDEDLMRFSRQSRSAGLDDRVVELKRPLGLVLNEDENGNVFVETVAPRGNAARTGIVSLDS